MGIHIVHSLHELANDMAKAAVTFKPAAARHVRDVAKDGQQHARRTARKTAGEHGKHYPKAITAERKAPLEWEWGPDPALKQGGMDFENGGGRQTTPHKNVARGADAHGAGDLARKVRGTFDEMFWA